MTSRTLLDVLTCSVLVWNSLSSSSVRGRKLSSFSGYSCQPMAFSNLRKRRYFFCLVACMKVCVCVRRSAGSCVVPVLSLQRARQVFGVWVTEGVGQTVLMADFFTVRFGLRGVAFTLKTFALEGGEGVISFTSFINHAFKKSYTALQAHPPQSQGHVSINPTKTHGVPCVCPPLLMFPGCCSWSALRCPRPSALAGTRSYGLDRDASAWAATGRCLWEELCWMAAVGGVYQAFFLTLTIVSL